jgi:retron-type reverse transcriptase
MAEQPGLWEQLITPENLWHAYVKAKKGKSRRPDVAKFSLIVEAELMDLRHSLVSGTYRPSGYRQFYVHDRKPRLISSAPFKDRVLQHALMQVVEPFFEKQFSDHSWACRQGKGTHGAVHCYQQWAKRYTYALKMDVAEYFHSIDHVCLLQKLRNLIDDPEIINLFQLIIDSAVASTGKGLPIGNLTSQALGNLYLDDLDHYITETLGFKAYVRYVDDMVILSDNKQQLWSALERIQHKLAVDHLVLHPRKIYITPTSCGLDFLGYRVYPRFIKLRHENGYHFRRRFKKGILAYQQGKQDWQQLNASVQAWLGHARKANTLGLRKALFSDTVITRGTSEQAVGPRRWLEQQTGEPAFRQPE